MDAHLVVVPRFRLARTHNRLLVTLVNPDPTRALLEVAALVSAVVEMGQLKERQQGSVELERLAPLCTKDLEVPGFFCDFDSILSNLDEAQFVRTIRDVNPLEQAQKLKERGYLKPRQPSVGVLSIAWRWRTQGSDESNGLSLEAPLYVWEYDHGVFLSLLQGGEGPEVAGPAAEVKPTPILRPPEAFSADVGLSFVEEDRAFADGLSVELERRSIRVFESDTASAPRGHPLIGCDAPYLLTLVSPAYAVWLRSNPIDLEQLRALARTGAVLPVQVSDEDPSVIDPDLVWIDDCEFDVSGIANLLARRLEDARRRAPARIQLRSWRLDGDSFRRSFDRWKSWAEHYLRYELPVEVALPESIERAFRLLPHRHDVLDSERARIARGARLLMAAEADGRLERALIDSALDSFVSSEAVYLARVAAALLGSELPAELERFKEGRPPMEGPVLAGRHHLFRGEWVGVDLRAKEVTQRPWEVNDRLFLPVGFAERFDGSVIEPDVYFSLVVPQLLLLEDPHSINYLLLYGDRFRLKMNSQRLPRA